MTTGTIVEHRKFVCVEFGDTNNNKLWQCTLFDNDDVLVEWGRIGKKLQSKTHYGVGQSKVSSLIRKKTNPNNSPDKLYTEVKAVDTGTSGSLGIVKNAQLSDVARKQIKHKNPLVQQLIDYLVKVNAHQIMNKSGGRIQYDSSTAQFKTPLGVIDPSQVTEARTLLVDIADFVSVNDYDNKNFPSTLNKYLRLIPHDVGMAKITPEMIFPSFAAVQSENDLLDGLDTSFIDVTTAPKKKNTKKKDEPKVFNVELSIIEDDKIISRVKNLYQKTRKRNHQSNNLSIKTVYQVNIIAMQTAFNKYGVKLKDVRRLWHGTKASNLLSIMRQGLVIPSSSAIHCTGRMYGDGVYFSSISTKALNYATNYWGGGGDTSRTFMFLADVAMGKCHIAGSGWGRYPISGTDSTWAKGGQSGVVNDEMIVYRLDQTNLVYLVEFCPRNK